MKYYILLIFLSPIMSTQWFIGAILGGIGGLIGLGTGIANTVSNVQTANKNNQISDEQNQLSKDAFEWQKSFAEQQFDYQKEQNELTRKREDDAVQRRAADLEAAGFSKTLAAGSPAQASTVSAGGSNNVNSPTLSKREAWKVQNLNAIATGLEFANAYEEIQNKRSQNNVNNARVGEILANSGLLTEKQKTELVDRLLKQSSTEYNRSRTATENYNREYSKDHNMRTTDNNMGVYNTMKDFVYDNLNTLTGKDKKEPDFNSSPKIKVGDKSELNKRYKNMASDYISKGNMNNLLNDFVKSNYDYIPGSSWREKTRWVLNNLNYN